MTDIVKSSILVSESIGRVSCITLKPVNPEWILVIAHGAGAGMDHSFMESLAVELAGHAMATVRYNFPYSGKKEFILALAEQTVAWIRKI